jgi:hypothetical protein
MDESQTSIDWPLCHICNCEISEVAVVANTAIQDNLKTCWISSTMLNDGRQLDQQCSRNNSEELLSVKCYNEKWHLKHWLYNLRVYVVVGMLAGIQLEPLVAMTLPPLVQDQGLSNIHSSFKSLLYLFCFLTSFGPGLGWQRWIGVEIAIRKAVDNAFGSWIKKDECMPFLYLFNLEPSHLQWRTFSFDQHDTWFHFNSDFAFRDW